MTGDGSEEAAKPSDRRHKVREKARRLRETQRKKDLRNRVILQGSIGVVVIAVVIAVVMIVVSSIKPESRGPKNMASDGIVIGKGLQAKETPGLAAGASPVASTTDPSVAHIRIYVDYLCPWCATFENTNLEQIEKWLDSGSAVLEVHPIAVLTSKSQGTEYSLRAANAAACIANYDPDAFFAFNRSLFAKQPDEGSAGLTDDQLTAVATSAGASGSVATCIEEEKFSSWVQASTQRAVNGPLPKTDADRVEATPTILVNGKQYTGSLEDAEEFKSFVITISSETQATATPSPSPSESDDKSSDTKDEKKDDSKKKDDDSKKDDEEKDKSS